MIQAVVLGIVQGLTEFLPISSSGHLVLVRWLLHWPDQGPSFDAALHLGTVTAILLVFGLELYEIVVGGLGGQSDRRRKQLVVLVLATIPAAVIGYFIQDTAEAIRSPLFIAVLLALFGLLLGLSERLANKKEDPTPSEGLMIGLAQALALLPGVSRSGITMTTGMTFGMSKRAATRFSFLLSVPIILGAGLFSVMQLRHSGAVIESEPVVGFLASAISGYFVIRWFLHYIQRRSLWPFVWYRIGLALLVLILVLVRR